MTTDGTTSAKKRKVDDDDDAGPSSSSASTGFNAATDVDNAADLVAPGQIPLLPRDGRALLLDIEGCTTAISFVHDVLFPFARKNVEQYLGGLEEEEREGIARALAEDASKLDDAHPARRQLAEKDLEGASATDAIVARVSALMDHDVKATGLKGLQGKIWKAGYASGELKGHIYDDFRPLLDWCKGQGVSVSIYSSGSVGAQKLLFGHSTAGDLCHYFNAHFDTTSGGKKEAQSYKNIARDLGLDPKDLCFVSDAEAELVAAREASVGFPVMSVRPGNKPLTDVGRGFPIVYSLLQLCGTGK